MPNTYGRVLITTLAWGVLAFGAVYPWAYWPLATACLALGVWGIVATQAWEDPRTRTLAIAVGAVIVAAGLQLVALPYSLIGRLSPALDRFFRDYELGYHPSALHTLSLSPAATLVAWALLVAFGTLLIGLVRGIRLVRPEWLVCQIMGLGMGMALVGIVIRAFHNEKDPRVYGFWQPMNGGNPFGPFVNRNHFAGWMVMMLPVVAMYSFALLQKSLAERGGHIRSGWASWGSSVEGNRFLLVAFASLIMGASLALTGSRSGVASFAIAVLVMIFFIVSRVRGRKKQFVAAGYLALVLVGAIGWAGFGMVASRFGKAGGELEGRFAAWRDTVQIMHDFPVFGVGLGSYGRAMLVYQTADRHAMYQQAHNDYLQVAAEGGLLIGIPALALLVVIGLGIVRRLRSDDDIITFWIRRGAVAGLIGIAAQSIVEFSLQMPGNTAWFVLLLALALHRSRPAQNANRV